MRLMNADAAKPFEFRGGDVGVLLVHGYTGSPCEMLPVGEYLSHRGITAVCPLLPGHGTRASELNRISWRQWFDAVIEAYDSLAKRCSTVFVAGLSMGGVLALHLAAHRPVAGVGAFASFLRPADWRYPIVEMIKYVMWYESKGLLDIEDPAGRAAFAGYDVYPTWGAAQMVRLCRHLEDELADIRCPVILMHGARDWTVRLEQMDIIASRLRRSREVTTVTLPASGHVVTLDWEKERVCTEFHQFVMKHAAQSVPRRANLERI